MAPTTDKRLHCFLSPEPASFSAKLGHRVLRSKGLQGIQVWSKGKITALRHGTPGQKRVRGMVVWSTLANLCISDLECRRHDGGISRRDGEKASGPGTAPTFYFR